MKAVIVSEFGPFREAGVIEVDPPRAGVGEVVVDVHAVEANYPDILVMEGNYQIKPPLPFSPGKAAAGVIASTGDGVEHVKRGDRVAVQVEYGAYAQQVLADAHNCYPVASDISFSDAAAMGLVYQTAHFALVERARLSAGETVLVLGASGGIGIASIQLAKALGASQVIAGVLGDDNARIARQAGADQTVELAGENLRDELRRVVFELTNGRGADIVIDPVGGAANAAALRSVAWRGRMVIIGFASGDIPVIKANYLLVKNIEVSGLQWSDYRERDPRWVAQVQSELFELFRRGMIKPLISFEFALPDFADALALLQDGKAQGKLILTVDQET